MLDTQDDRVLLRLAFPIKRSMPKTRQPFANIKLPGKPCAPKSIIAPRLFSETSAQTVNFPIDYSDFVPIRFPETGEEIFSGVLHYIYFHSMNHYNTRELTIHYPQPRRHSNPVNLLNARDTSVFASANGERFCLIFEFHRISIHPTSFAFRYPLPQRRVPMRPLWGFLFQGWYERKKCWVTLTEWWDIGDLRGGPCLTQAFVDTGLEFRIFRLLETSGLIVQLTHVAIEAFEIHGSIRVIDNPLPESTDKEDSPTVFDPWLILDYE
jgi:hypothetical protein